MKRAHGCFLQAGSPTGTRSCPRGNGGSSLALQAHGESSAHRHQQLEEKRREAGPVLPTRRNWAELWVARVPRGSGVPKAFRD